MIAANAQRSFFQSQITKITRRPGRFGRRRRAPGGADHSARAIRFRAQARWPPLICNGGYPFGALDHFSAGRSLPRPQKRFNQRALSANNHLRETLEPLTLWDFWFGNEPVSELTKLIGGNFSLRDSIEQMIEQCWREILPPNFRHFFADRRSRERSAREFLPVPPDQSMPPCALPDWITPLQSIVARRPIGMQTGSRPAVVADRVV
jgi:hypothetical protein